MNNLCGSFDFPAGRVHPGDLFTGRFGKSWDAGSESSLGGQHGVPSLPLSVPQGHNR